MKSEEKIFQVIHNPQEFIVSERVFETKPISNYKTHFTAKPEFSSETAERAYLDKVRQNLSSLSKEFIEALNKITSVKQMYAFLITNLYCLSPGLAKKLLIMIHF